MMEEAPKVIDLPESSDEQLREQVWNGIKDLVEINEAIPSTAHCTHPLALLELDTGDAAPIYVHQYPIPHKYHDKVEKTVATWITNGWVEEGPPTSERGYPLVAAKKKDELGGA